MRTFALFALILLSGCGPDGLAALPDLTGTWAERFTLPGAGFGFTLTQLGDSVFGSGNFAIEAGRAGTLSVAGRYDRPALRLRIDYDFGLRRDFVGQVVETHMIGTLTDSLGHAYSLVLHKQ